jgi:hypothetical protein
MVAIRVVIDKIAHHVGPSATEDSCAAHGARNCKTCRKLIGPKSRGLFLFQAGDRVSARTPFNEGWKVPTNIGQVHRCHAGSAGHSTVHLDGK